MLRIYSSVQKEAAADIDQKYHLCLTGRRDREVRLAPPPPHSSSSMQFKLKSSVVIKFKLGLRWGPKTRLRHNRERAERMPHGGSRFTKGSSPFKQPVCTKAFWHLKKWIKTTERGNERREKINYSSFPPPQTDLFSLASSASCLLDRLQNCQ